MALGHCVGASWRLVSDKPWYSHRNDGEHAMNIQAPIQIRTWTGALVRKLVELHEQQKTFSQIAEIIGMSRNACIGKARRLGLERTPDTLSPEDKKLRDEARSQAMRARRLTFRENRGTYAPRAPRHPKPINDLREIALHISFEDLKSFHCRFPYGDKDFTFCGHPKVKGSYCAPHAIYCTEAPR